MKKIEKESREVNGLFVLSHDVTSYLVIQKIHDFMTMKSHAY